MIEKFFHNAKRPFYIKNKSQQTCAEKIENAVRNVLKKGFRTKDIFSENKILVGCEEMGNKIIEELENA